MGVFSNRIDREELKPGDHIYSWREAYIYAHHGIYVGEGMVIHFTRGGQEIRTGTVLDRLLLSSCLTRSANDPCPNHFPRGGQEIRTGTVLDRLLLSSCLTRSAKDPCPKCGDQSNRNGVIDSCLDCFLFGGHLYRFEYGVSPAFFLAKARGGTCTLAPSDPPEDVLPRARYLLQNGFGVYDAIKNNCEDFAIYCKTGLLVIPNISVGPSGQAASYVAAFRAVDFSAVVSLPLRFLTTSFSGLALVGFGRYCMSRLDSDIGVRRDVAKVPVESVIIILSAFDEPAKTNEVNRLIEPPGLDEQAQANKVTKEE